MAQFKKVILFFSLVFLAGCANQLPPTGGPADTIPPEIVAVYPADGTIGYQEEYFELEFSEYIQNRTLRESIFISPAVDGTLETDFSGTSVKVYFPGPLKQGYTYTITVGTDVVDYNNNNRMANSYTFRFSTGDKIDNGVITGKVYSEKPSGVMLFAFRDHPDSAAPLLRKPDYISQAGEKGDYTFSGLRDGEYTVFAVRDEFKDLIYKQEQDEIGIPSGKFTLSAEDSVQQAVHFYLSKFDTIPPVFQNAIMTDSRHIFITLSEKPDSSVIKSERFSIIDSTSGEVFIPIYAFKGRGKEKEFFLALKDSLPPGLNYYLHCDTLMDQAKNYSLNQSVALTVSERPDTSAPLVIGTEPKPAMGFPLRGAYIDVLVDDGFDQRYLASNISITDTSKKKHPFTVRQLDDASFRITIDTVLAPRMEYLLRVSYRIMKDVAGNFRDTVYSTRFRTLSDLDFTGLSGSVTNVDYSRNPRLVLEKFTDRSYTYSIPIGQGGKFSFTGIEPAKYRLWLYYDTDSNKVFSYGTPVPLQYAEEFRYFPELIDLPPRWAVTDLIFDYATAGLAEKPVSKERK